MPPLFSAQLEDWLAFRHKWQWDNRGSLASDEGFSAFLESRRCHYLHRGEVIAVSDPSFEAAARQAWTYEQRSLETFGTAGFAAYACAVDASPPMTSRRPSSWPRTRVGRTRGPRGSSISAMSTGGLTGTPRP